MSNSFEFYKNYILTGSNDTFRIQQAEILDKLLTEEFNFDYVECIETGCSYGGYDDFGTYLGHFCQEKNGKLSTVDIVKESIDKSKIFYTTLLPNLQVEFCIGDSIEFLKKYNGNPNLVHLDSWDLKMTNPASSMLHGWLEFSAIKDKMPSGSICIIDDNYFNGTTVYWNILNDGVIVKTQPIDVTYDVVGKGTLVYHWVKNYSTEWDLIGNHYHAGDNVKLIFKKK
jgi:hypothetical protein